MKQQSLFEAIGNNPYPGRGIILGQTSDGTRAALAYFIMGRSAGSRSRAFTKDGDNLAIRMLDGGKIADTSLILYTVKDAGARCRRHQRRPDGHHLRGTGGGKNG